MTKLDKYMRNQGKGNFDFDSFKVMYDADPKIQALVTNFDQVKIEFKQVNRMTLQACQATQALQATLWVTWLKAQQMLALNYNITQETTYGLFSTGIRSLRESS